MTADARANLISLLQETDGRWEATLPAKAGTFYGQRIAVLIDTEVPVWGDRSISPETHALLISILQNLPSLLDQANQAFDRYASDEPDVAEHIARVRIQLYPGTPQPSVWTLNIEFNDSDSVFYVWFDGLRLIEAWCGD